jgi:hypothetical protein
LVPFSILAGSALKNLIGKQNLILAHREKKKDPKKIEVNAFSGNSLGTKNRG